MPKSTINPTRHKCGPGYRCKILLNNTAFTTHFLQQKTKNKYFYVNILFLIYKKKICDRKNSVVRNYNQLDSKLHI